MKKEFNWDKFRIENIAVHCKTQREANKFFEIMYYKNIIKERDGINCWYVYEENTCYIFDKYKYGWEYCYKKYYEDNDYIILEFSDYFDVSNKKESIKDKPKSHYGEIKFNGDCFIVKEREECCNPEWMYLCDLFGLDYDATERIVIDGIVKYFRLRKGE